MDLNSNLKKHQGLHPKLIVCHICGREFGSKSLPIHIKACTEKWNLQQSKLPKSQRKPLPKAPDQQILNLDIPIEKLSLKEKEEYNNQANSNFLEGGRDPCPNCARKFLPDSLIIHLRSCKPGGYFERQKKSSSPQK
ncbi:hypothetical protein HK099_000557 [Clydaea vesicula]|uniref:C2HC/C3H-type domain-containing protein n=1 Tax=Clydaea vesicula TaxID=447962 RepID=A0AAD5Y254_9FUNG|nr:hypothetical protein HK099_000557 [Clydaea vesicula]KAJ3393595.1 hypothetical protein HDU92_007634 [Lobulomyces angularis]